MKLPLTLIVIMGALVSPAWPAEPVPAPAYPPHIVPNTELRVLPRTRPDRQYQLHIALPSGFREHPEKKYPVVFVTDGYYDFTTVVAIYGNLVFGKNVPPMIVVGLGYAGENLNYDVLRGDDLSPLATTGWPASGDAAQFLSMIETVAIPLLEKEYRTDPKHRYLMGCSAGGMFALYTALTKPELFQGYVADSPAVGWLWNYERAFAQAGRMIKARVFISAAENEWKMFRQQIGGFYRRLRADGIVQGGLQFRAIENVRHSSGKPEAYTQGLLFVTEPIAPERGVSTDWQTDPQNRPGFVANFWLRPGEVGAKQSDAIQAHDAYWARLFAEKKVEFVGATPAGVMPRFWAENFFAADRAAAEALVRADPAVKSGVLTYELIEVTE